MSFELEYYYLSGDQKIKTAIVTEGILEAMFSNPNIVVVSFMKYVRK